MSQHDQVIDNGSGLTVRTDMNAAIAALFSSSSGPVEPSVTVAGQPWFDTGNASNPVLRLRNLANTGWLTIFQAGQAAIDIAAGKRAGPPNDTFVWNDKIDLSGTDVMTLSDIGNLSITGKFSAGGDIVTTGGLTVGGAVNFGALNATSLALTLVDPGAAVGPTLSLYRDSASPAVSDILAGVYFAGRDAANAKQNYADIYTSILNPVAASRSGRLVFETAANGALVPVLTADATSGLVTPYSVSSGGNFISQGTVAILAATGAGTVYLRPNGAGNNSGQLYVASGGGLVTWSTIQSMNGSGPSMGDDGSARYFQTSPGYALHTLNATGATRILTNSAVRATWDNSNNFTASGQCWKPGGGPWSDTSDARIKTVLGDYESGLDAILALHPVRYTFKGNDTKEEPHGEISTDEDGNMQTDEATTAPYANSMHYQAALDGTEYIGLIAQETETVMPEMVMMSEGFIDGVAVTDLRGIDTTPLVYALINAVKELAAKVEALEAR